MNNKFRYVIVASLLFVASGTAPVEAQSIPPASNWDASNIIVLNRNSPEPTMTVIDIADGVLLSYDAPTGGFGVGTSERQYNFVTTASASSILTFDLSIDAINGGFNNTLTLEVLHNGNVVSTLASTTANTYAASFPNQSMDLNVGDSWGIRATAGNFSESTGTSAEILVTSNVDQSPICDIQLNQTSFVDGDTVTADVFRVANLTSAPVAAELKVWQGSPEMPPISFINIGADGSLVLPAGMDVDLGPVPFFQVTADLPSGTYELSCRLLDPVTGGLLSEDLNNFNIRDANLVTNSGFESGATGWVFSDGNPENNRDVGTCPSPCTNPHTGSWAGFKNLFDGGSGTISQSIATSIGTEYMVELWLADNNVEFGTVTASFGGTLGVSVTGADTSTTHSMYSFTHTATSALTDFVFGGVVTNGTFFIDDVSIVAVQ